uniref:Lipoprotein n=1 Tax=Mycobacterium phage Pharb TaxID=3136626 RepID=A0AAU8GP97_9VIRU
MLKRIAAAVAAVLIAFGASACDPSTGGSSGGSGDDSGPHGIIPMPMPGGGTNFLIF